MMRLTTGVVSYDLLKPFRISRGMMTQMQAVAVTVEAAGVVGRGEGVGVAYLGETPDSMLAQLEAARPFVEAGISRADLQSLMPSGGARNAVDAALWDFEAKRTGRRAWELAGLSEPAEIPCTATLSLDTPEKMAAAAVAAPPHSALKIKLGAASEDLARVQQVRAAAPHSRLLADANGGWRLEDLKRLAPELARLGVEMIEQPLARGDDAALAGWLSPIPLCADESCQDRSELGGLRIRGYAMINIKLDKTGGLTEALALATAAAAEGMPYMMGCMLESSLGLAPATLVAHGAIWCDLDGPAWLATDAGPRLQYREGRLGAPDPALWG
jgi:L-alanine-DL-glutamate epimerase-like enolase superfamily enzyme